MRVSHVLTTLAVSIAATALAPPAQAYDGGLPMKCYIKLGTRYERVVKNRRDYGNGKPEESYVIKGVARENRQMVVEVVERAD